MDILFCLPVTLARYKIPFIEAHFSVFTTPLNLFRVLQSTNKTCKEQRLRTKGPFTQAIFVQSFLSRRFNAIFVALKSHPQIACVNGRRYPGYQCDLGTICRRDKKSHKNRLCKPALKRQTFSKSTRQSASIVQSLCLKCC